MRKFKVLSYILLSDVECCGKKNQFHGQYLMESFVHVCEYGSKARILMCIDGLVSSDLKRRGRSNIKVTLFLTCKHTFVGGKRKLSLNVMSCRDRSSTFNVDTLGDQCTKAILRIRTTLRCLKHRQSSPLRIQRYCQFLTVASVLGLYHC